MKGTRRRQAGLYRLGKALCSAIDTPRDGARVPCTADALHELGKKLMRIGDGEVAAKIFGHGAGRPSMSARDSQIALVYWAARAVGDHSSGVKAVRSKWPDLNLADSAIYDIAKRLKDYALGNQDTAGALEFDLTNGLQGVDTDEVRRRTKRRDGRGNAEWRALGAAARATPAKVMEDIQHDDICSERRNKKHATLSSSKK